MRPLGSHLEKTMFDLFTVVMDIEGLPRVFGLQRRLDLFAPLANSRLQILSPGREGRGEMGKIALQAMVSKHEEARMNTYFPRARAGQCPSAVNSPIGRNQ